MSKTTSEDTATLAGKILALDPAKVGGKGKGAISVEELVEAAQTLAGSALAQAEDLDPRGVATRTPAYFKADGHKIAVEPAVTQHNDGTASTGLRYVLLHVVDADGRDTFEAAELVAKALNNCPSAVASINP